MGYIFLKKLSMHCLSLARAVPNKIATTTLVATGHRGRHSITVSINCHTVLTQQ